MALGVAVYESTDALDIWVPAATSTAVGVRDIISKAWAFATDIAYRCHVHTPWVKSLTSSIKRRKISGRGGGYAN